MGSNLESESSDNKPDQFDIIVVDTMDVAHYIAVTTDTSVREVKEVMFEKTGKNPDDQTLTFEGEDLDDKVTIGWYWIKKDDELEMKNRNKDESNIQTDLFKEEEASDVGSMIVNVELQSTFEEVDVENASKDDRIDKVDDQERMGQKNETNDVLGNMFEIIVTDQDSGEMTIGVNRETSMLNIKQKISVLTGLKTMDMMLLMEGERLEDTEVMGFYGMERGSMMQMKVFRVYRS